jgi:MFS family permease
MSQEAPLGGHVSVATRSRGASVKNVIAAVIGNAFEFYDFAVYASFAVALGRVFFPVANPNISLLLSVVTFGVGFIARPLGGILIGAFADVYGRKPAMTMTISMMALSTGAIGLLPGYAQIGVAAPILLVLARLIQGFSTGGEMGPATVFLLEAAQPRRRCFFASWQIASQNMGGIVSGLVGIVLALALPHSAMDDWGWRVPFLLGVLIAPVGFYIRRRLNETLDRREAHDRLSAIWADLFTHHRAKIALCLMIVSGATVTQYFFIYTTTYALSSLGFSQGVAMTTLFVHAVVGTVFAVVGGLLADRFGIKPVALLPRLIVTLLLYPAMWFALDRASPGLFIATIGVLMAFHAMATGAAIVFITSVFPAAVRTAGLSISYTVGVALFGGTAQIVFTWIIGTTGDKFSWIWYVVAMGVVSVLGTTALKPPHTPTSASPLQVVKSEGPQSSPGRAET